MKNSDLKKRLKRDRAMTSVTLRMPEDVVDDLRRVAPLLGFSGYQPLIRHYVGQGLRVDLERLEGSPMERFIAGLRSEGVDEAVIERALGGD